MPLFITNEIKEIIKKEVLEEIREENNKTIEELNEKFKIISKLKLIKLFAKFYCRGE